MSARSTTLGRAKAHWPALVVLLTGLLVTVALAVQVSTSVNAKDRERFNAATQRVQAELASRLDAYLAMLRAGAGLMAAQPDVSRDEFGRFVARLQLEHRYPGIQGIGFSHRLEPGEVAEFVARQRREGYPDYRVWPAGARDEYHTIVFLEPLDRRNRAAIGYDMSSERTRRQAMARARDTGEAAASGPVTLVQEIDEKKQVGFLIYLPVYKGGAVPATQAERRERLLGFVYSPFRTGDLFAATYHGGPGVAFALHDGTEQGPLLYRSVAFPDDPRFSTASEMAVSGRSWTLRIVSTHALDRGSARGFVTLILIAGVLTSFLLAALTAAQTRERRRAEHNQLAVAENFERLTQLANSIPQLVWMARPDGWLYWYNQRWYEYTGTRPEQVEGWGWQDSHDPHELPRVMRQWKAGIAAGAPFELEFPLRGADGAFRWFLTRVHPFRNARGEIVQWFGTNTDVQARREVETAMQRLLERERASRVEAERVSQLKDEFLATLSHELRTPLNAVIGWAQILADTRLTDERRAKAVGTILRNARGQARLIDDLLDMSRIISGKVRLEFRELDLADVIDAAMNVVRPTAEAKGVRLASAIDPDTPFVRGDPGRLQQVLWNLLSNAVKFTAAGGRVDVELRRSGGHVQMIVRDTGHGIEPDFLPYVFDRFRQADASTTRQHGGLGLGLSIVRSLVEMHGGSVHAVSSGTGQGATFVVSLPPAAGAETLADRLVAAETAAVAPGDSILRGVRVLVVDDDTDASELVQVILAQHGAEVTAVGSGDAALREIQTAAGPFHLLVSDLGMPQMSGYEMLRRIRALSPERGGMPAIALSAYARREDRDAARDAGYDLHITKPFNAAAMVLACVDLLDRSSRRV